MSANHYLAYPAGVQLAAILSTTLLARFSGPDLSALTLFVPHHYLDQDVQNRLLHDSTHEALLTPRFITLDQWAQAYPDPSRRRLSSAERHLMMADVLNRYRRLFGDSDVWSLGQQVFQLLDELSQRRVQLPDNVDEFIGLLQTHYAAPQSVALSREANIVHSLWRAWQDTLNEHALSDPLHDYFHALQHQRIAQPDLSYVAGHDQLLPAEWQWLQQHQNLTVILPDYAYQQAPKGLEIECIEHPSALRELIEQAQDSGERNLRQRADAARQQAFELDQQQLSLLPCPDWEEETTAVVRLCRQWLHEGITQLLIVTENRQFARRLRARLDSAGISLQDSAGWLLSTTSAAAIIERWLECIEQDFHHLSLLDVLKSSLMSGFDEQLQHWALQLQRDVIEHEGIAANLQRMQTAIHARQRRLDHADEYAAPLTNILQRLDDIAQPLLALTQQPKIRASTFINTLLDNLQALTLTDALQNDSAGERVWAVLSSLQLAAEQQDTVLSWGDCRAWLAQELESHTFIPRSPRDRVWLTDIKGARGMNAEGLIVASADDQHLPKFPSFGFFFNDAVRGELGLETRDDLRLRAFSRLTHLVVNAQRCVFTYSESTDQGPQLPGAWIDTINTFHQLRFGHDLINAEWLQLARALDPHEQPSHQGTASAKGVMAAFPAKLSASRHQTLIDCPYRFFAQEALGLSAREAVSEALSYADYGHRVHRCLQIFHQGLGEEHWGRFEQPLERQHRDAAIAQLTRLAVREFQRDVENNAEQRHWLRRFEQHIPAYIDWQIQHQENDGWRITDMERAESTVLLGKTLLGRIDAVEKRGDCLGLMDFKTGNAPSAEDMLNGENVQLSSYAVMQPDSSELRYVKLGNPVKISEVRGDELDDIRTKTQARLEQLIQDIDAGAALPATPHDVCRHCDFGGLCRHQDWN